MRGCGTAVYYAHVDGYKERFKCEKHTYEHMYKHRHGYLLGFSILKIFKIFFRVVLCVIP